MCDLFSWIEDKDGKVWFLDDKDCEILMEKNQRLTCADVIGHRSIKKMYAVTGELKESVLDVPPEIRNAVNEGKCDRMIKENGWAGLRYGADGKISAPWWPGKFIESLKTIRWMANHGEIKPEWKVFETRDAARDEAWDAAWDAACNASKYAAGDASKYAAWDVAKYAAWDVAKNAAGFTVWDAALYSVCFIAFHKNPKNKYLQYAKRRMEVWRRGYGLLCDVDNVFYVYKKT